MLHRLNFQSTARVIIVNIFFVILCSEFPHLHLLHILHREPTFYYCGIYYVYQCNNHGELMICKYIIILALRNTGMCMNVPRNHSTEVSEVQNKQSNKHHDKNTDAQSASYCNHCCLLIYGRGLGTAVWWNVAPHHNQILLKDLYLFRHQQPCLWQLHSASAHTHWTNWKKTCFIILLWNRCLFAWMDLRSRKLLL